MRLAFLYISFAAVATIANIACQDIAVRITPGNNDIVISVLAGTGVGLLVKYLLDKKYIFVFRARDIVHDSKLFLLYTFMGVFTTAIFWSFEFGFHILFQSRPLRYLGAMLGLSIGYWMKYRLDKRFVFRKEEA